MVIFFNILFFFLSFIPSWTYAVIVESLPLEPEQISSSTQSHSHYEELLERQEELSKQNLSLQKSLYHLEEKVDNLEHSIEDLRQSIESFGQHQREFMGYIAQSLLHTGSEQSSFESERAYDLGLELMKQNKIQAALTHWQEFLEQYHASEQAPYAYYWISEIYYLLQEDDLAKDSYSFLVKNYPNFEKNPDALYKIAQILYNQGSHEKAEEHWQHIIQRYPKSSAAALSKQQLTDIASS